MRSSGRSGLVVTMILLGAASAQAAPAGDGPSIFGGEPARVGDWPAVVGVILQVSPTSAYQCTGTLIAPDWVLTAAHCVDPTGIGTQDDVTSATRVILDSVDLWRPGGTRLRASATLASPQFDSHGLTKFDVGLIRLATPVTDRTPVRLNRHNLDAPPGIAVTMVGYGVTSPTDDGGVLYSLGKPSIACTVANLSDAFLLCFDQTDGTGQCYGDSGGPTFATIDGVVKQVGIASFGGGDLNCGGYAAQTRVDVVFNWIADQLGPAWRCAADDECSPRCGAFGNPIDPDCTPCGGDGDCGFQQVCQPNQACGPAPLTPNGLGATCTDDAHCGSADCRARGDETLCTQPCTSDDACPAGFDCVAGDGVCWPAPPASGGCSAAGGDGSPAVLLLATLATLMPARRRRARRR